MKKIYLSRPLDLAMKEQTRLIEKLLLKFLDDKKLILDQNNMYKIIHDWAWANDSSKNNFLTRASLISKRIRYMSEADYFIFLEQWMDLPECKIDWDILINYNMTNHITLVMKDGELRLAEGLPQRRV